MLFQYHFVIIVLVPDYSYCSSISSGIVIFPIIVPVTVLELEYFKF